ncbi:hypothetical protein GCM10023189_01870 [Nibrella saemangeumensis]|uniref:Pyrrolo-quinoline quinone repeat domain-containing protein n=1 Tax=Nibrella saemangeumensis TaxID=1084526 RepID=A0ABP8MB88_9BACT
MKAGLATFLIAIHSLALGQSSAPVNSVDSSREPAVKWKLKTQGPVIGAPVIRENTAYVGGLDSTLYAINVNTGTAIWKVKLNGVIRSTPCLGTNQLYVMGGDAILHAFDPTTGKRLWQFRTLGGILGERRYDFADYFHSSPRLHNNTLYVGSGDGRVYALKADTGDLLWSYQTGDIVHTTPAIQNDRLFVGSLDGYLYALNTHTGALIWKFKSVGHRYFPKGEMQGLPVVGNGLVYIGSRDYNLYALDAQAGYGHWTKSFPLGWATTLTVRDSVLYIGTSDDRLLAAVDGRTGRELWRINTQFNIFGGMAFSAATGYFGTLMGKVFSIDLKTGAVRWTFTTDGYRQNRDRYFKPDDTFRADIGSIIRVPEDFLQLYYRMGAIFSAPTLSGKQLFIGSADGTIYCLEEK